MSRRTRSFARAAVCLSIAFGIAAVVRAADPLSDPTRPEIAAETQSTTTPSTPEALVLHAILHAEDRRLAVVNGRRVVVGDFVDGAHVLAIEADHVRVERAGETLELELVSPAFKRVRAQERRAAPHPSEPDAPSVPAQRGSPQ